MKKDPIEQGRFTERGKGLGTVTEKMIRARAAEIAVINGRIGENVIEADLEQARRELQGKEQTEPAESKAEHLLEGERWPGVSRSRGRKAHTKSPPDEQTFAGKLVEEGVAEAEHEQALEATRENLRREQQSDPDRTGQTKGKV